MRMLRRRRKMTQRDLARYLGLSFSTISMYERGEREPDLKTIQAMADLFEVDMNYLIMSHTGRVFTDEDLKFALFGTRGDEISDEMIEDVKLYARFIKEKKAKDEE